MIDMTRRAWLRWGGCAALAALPGVRALTQTPAAPGWRIVHEGYERRGAFLVGYMHATRAGVMRYVVLTSQRISGGAHSWAWLRAKLRMRTELRRYLEERP